MELLCLTGVEDQLQVCVGGGEGERCAINHTHLYCTMLCVCTQADVRPTLELLRNAGIKVWMLTGDKMETATSIALSSRLIARTQNIYTFKQVGCIWPGHGGGGGCVDP